MERHYFQAVKHLHSVGVLYFHVKQSSFFPLSSFNYLYYPVDMTTSLLQWFMWIIESYTSVVAT